MQLRVRCSGTARKGISHPFATVVMAYNGTKIVQTSAMRACSFIAECSLSYAKIVQTSAMGACSFIAECSLSYAKIVQTSAMRACSFIAECSLSYAKIMTGECRSKNVRRSFTLLDTAEPHLILCKDNDR